MKFLNYRLLIFILAFIFGIVFSLPSFLNIEGKKVHLGLDLQGGLSLLLEADTDEAVKNRFVSIASSIDYQTNQKSILINDLRALDSSVEFVLLDEDDIKETEEILSKIRGIMFEKDELSYKVLLTNEEIESTRKLALEQAITTIRNRLGQFGLTEPSVTQQGKDNILVELPGGKNAEDEERIKDLISKAAFLQLMAVDEERTIRVNEMSDIEAQKYGDVILPYADSIKESKGSKLLLKALPIIDGSMISDARVAYDQNGEPVVSFELDSNGAKRFGDFSGANIRKRMAIVLDGKIYSAPVIRERISSSGQISGNFSVEEAKDLAITLRSGSLPIPLSVVEKRSVGPSLGADSIRASLLALIGGFVLVVGFMIFYYSMAGVVASFALIVNLLLIIAVMAIFNATLTLPGMAGIVLTVGIAVDANIIINERIREALKSGESILKSIQTGYINASRAIFDSNLTSIIAAVLLYAYGTGPIKGFALTTCIGILASIVTAIIGTQGFYQAILPKLEHSKRPFLWFGISAKNIESKTKGAK